jgi:hypothetical protein
MPEIDGIFAFEDTMDWITKEWEAKIKPELLAQLIMEIT